ncbi:hypothetical protein GCM10018777_25300 [Streptomyces albogriseolus]|nr:hypothetical protein GCM10018777_25300 [Streptomyces viridodiastaticus]
MDRLMQTAFPFPTHPLSEIGDAPWAPLADVEDTGDAYVMELELPGVEKDHITVELTQGGLGDAPPHRDHGLTVRGPPEGCPRGPGAAGETRRRPLGTHRRRADPELWPYRRPRSSGSPDAVSRALSGRKADTAPVGLLPVRGRPATAQQHGQLRQLGTARPAPPVRRPTCSAPRRYP